MKRSNHTILMRLSLLLVVAAVGCASDAQAQMIVLDNFNSGTASGTVMAGTNWELSGNVVQNPTSITIGGSALDINGWSRTGLDFSAVGMNYIVITGQRASGHNASANFVVEFTDSELDRQVFSISTSFFNVGSPTQVQIPIVGWNSSFDSAHITEWTIGGGSPVGLLEFHMTLDDLSMSATAGGSAVPEPATYALWSGLASFGFVSLWRMRRRRRIGR